MSGKMDGFFMPFSIQYDGDEKDARIIHVTYGIEPWPDPRRCEPSIYQTIGVDKIDGQDLRKLGAGRLSSDFV